ncbi:MAG: hypothetical protein QY328_12330 [Anaerolineales bacterium]|nr:MAG: hypothetical protein QY328_12330 [Anaerolineales bacterium]
MLVKSVETSKQGMLKNEDHVKVNFESGGRWLRRIFTSGSHAKSGRDFSTAQRQGILKQTALWK